MSKVRFQILPPIDRPEQPVLITGNLPALGEWQPEAALRLDWRARWHVGEIEAETGSAFEYKILRGSWEAEAVDAYGSIPGNCRHEVWLDATLHHTVADWKDRYCGRLTRERLHSRVLAGERELLIWLPPSYPRQAGRRFPIVVLSDGANIFDPRTSPLTGVDWAADEWISLLSRQGVMPEAIVVGICHPEGYAEENVSLRDFELSPEFGGAAYAHFVTRELIPFLDSHYQTIPEPGARVLGGGGLGALLAFYVLCHHPGTYGNFLCLSTTFEDMSRSPADLCGQLNALAAEPALDPTARVWFDYGTLGPDAASEPCHSRLKTLLTEKGWREGNEFSIRRIDGSGHDELSWRQRLGQGLRFLAR